MGAFASYHCILWWYAAPRLGQPNPPFGPHWSLFLTGELPVVIPGAFLATFMTQHQIHGPRWALVSSSSPFFPALLVWIFYGFVLGMILTRPVGKDENRAGQ